MRIQTKIMLAALAVFIVAMAFTGLIVFSAAKADIEDRVQNQLVSASQKVENSINTFLAGQENKIELIANQNDLSDEELVQMVGIDDTFYDMFLIAPNGTVVRSSNPARVGLDRSNRPYFTEARNKTFISPVYFALVPQQYSIAVSTPFRGGVLVGSMKLNVLEKIVSERAGLGKTGESLLAFKNEKNEVVFFTKRLFSEKEMEAFSEEKAKGFPIYSALNGEERVFRGLSNYRGRKVISVTSYIDSIKVGAATNIDEEEAFASVKTLQDKTLAVVLAVMAVIALVLFFVTKPVSNEIVSITNDIDTITKGNLDVQLKKSRTKEIQNLRDSLNRILASMKLAILRMGLSKEDIGLGEAIKAKEEAENKYKLLFDNSMDAIFITGFDGKFLDVNETACARLGYTRNELLKLGPEKVDSPKFAELVPKRFKELKEKGQSVFESAHIAKSGREIPIELSNKVIDYNGAPAILGIARDITFRKDMENRYKRLYESSADAIMTLAPPKWSFTAGNPSAIKMFGAKNEKDFTSRAPWQFSPKKQPDGRMSSAKAKEMIGTAMRKGSNFFEWTHRRLDGKNFKATVLLTRVDENGKKYLQATVRDLTGSKLGESGYDLILDGVNEMVQRVDSRGMLVYVNKKWMKVMGYKKEDALKLSLKGLIAPGHLKKCMALFKKVRGGKQVEAKAVLLAKNRKRVNVEISASPLFGGSGNFISTIGILREIKK